jgi:hypothetical protein
VVKRRAAPRPLNGIPLSRLTPDQVVARLAMKKGVSEKGGQVHFAQTRDIFES